MSTIESIKVNVEVKLSLWSAIKLRIAGWKGLTQPGSDQGKRAKIVTEYRRKIGKSKK